MSDAAHRIPVNILLETMVIDSCSVAAESFEVTSYASEYRLNPSIFFCSYSSLSNSYQPKIAPFSTTEQPQPFFFFFF